MERNRDISVSAVNDAIMHSAAILGIELKEKQHEAILSFCQGRDVFVSLPTGYGKSVIYGLLPLVFNMLNGKVTIAYCIK